MPSYYFVIPKLEAGLNRSWNFNSFPAFAYYVVLPGI